MKKSKGSDCFLQHLCSVVDKMVMGLTKRKTKLLKIAGFVAVVSLVLFYLGNKISTDEVVEFVEGTGIWGPIVFIVLITLSYVFAPLSGFPVWFAGYVVFGKTFLIYTYIAAIASAAINFKISQKWGRRTVATFVGKEGIKKIYSFSDNYGVRSLVFLRLFVGSFHDFISYAYGFTNVKFSTYLTITIIAGIPWNLFMWFYLLEKVNSNTDFVIKTTSMFLILGTVGILYIKKLHSTEKI